MTLSQSVQKVLYKITSIFSEQQHENEIVLHESIAAKPLEFDKIFKSIAPVVMEFGVGKGRFMREYASKYPNKNFFGVEKVNKWVKHTAARIQRSKLENVKLIKTDANFVLAQTQHESISEYYILFPDPWPKRRHQQRRIIQTKLIDKIHKTLVENGKLYIATDHESYFQWMNKIITPFLEAHFKKLENEKIEFISNYQVKYEREGRPIYSIHLMKQ